MHTIEEMAITVEGWFHKGSASDQQKFLNTPKSSLIKYHSSLGRDIRNEFKLWENYWKPDIRDGVDHSPEHPEQLSMTVIETVWEKLKNENL